MKPKPKKRRKKKTKKVHAVLESNTRMEIGGKIISQQGENGNILIENNNTYNKNWGIKIIAFGVIFSLLLFKISSGEFSWFYVSVIAAPILFFGFMGWGYMRRSKSSIQWVFNLDKKVFSPTLEKEIPFNKISHFHITEVESALNYASSYQLNMIFKNQNEVMLFTSDSSMEIEEAYNFLQQKTGIGI